MTHTAIPLVELNRRIGRTLAAAPGLTGVWITAETSDLRNSGAHCYMELIQKDDTGTPLARCRAVIWGSNYNRLDAAFCNATGTRLRSDMKIMACVNVSFHAVFGLSLVITDIDPSYTVGDLARRRAEIIARLRADGVLDTNRDLQWSLTPQRVAVVSAPGAAGYGDFIRHLHGNARRLRFSTTLFEAVMQGEHTSESVIAALDRIMERVDDFDCVVVIRGGGAVADLASFDDYDLAFNIAQFPLPVIVGIGHDRDITVLDYVANTRVKTPTAAAEVLIGRVGDALDTLIRAGENIRNGVRDIVSDSRRQLSYYLGVLPALAGNVVERNRRAVGESTARLIADSAQARIESRRRRLEALGEVLEAISPEATLRRGYSITRVNGHAVTDSTVLSKGTVVTTTFATGPNLDLEVI